MPAIVLHPAIADDYRHQIAELHLARANPEVRLQAIPVFAASSTAFVLTPNPEGRGVKIEIEGKLAAIIALAAGKPVAPSLTAKVERVKGFK